MNGYTEKRLQKHDCLHEKKQLKKHEWVHRKGSITMEPYNCKHCGWRQKGKNIEKPYMCSPRDKTFYRD